MTYTVNISGHKQFDTQEEAKDFEQSVCDKAKQLVDQLDGCIYAHFTGNQVNENLLAPQ